MSNRHPWYRHGERGGVLVEFALIAPVFLLLVAGGLEMAHTMYVRSVLVGQLQKAARDLSLEDASASTRQDAITASIRDAVQNVVPSATVMVVPKSYRNYGNAQDPAEEYNDADHDGTCNHGEAFVDSNRNGHWDADGSVDSRGGARDVVVLTATATYDRLPLGRMFGEDAQMEIVAKTLIRNQPSDQQADALSGICP